MEDRDTSALNARDNATNSAEDQSKINAASGSAPLDGTRQNTLDHSADGLSGSEGAGTTVKPAGQVESGGPQSGLSFSPGEMRLADRISIRVPNPGSGDVILLLAGDPHEKTVSASELCALIEDKYWA